MSTDTTRRQPVIIVDDDPGTLVLLAEHLRVAGYEPVVADTGQEALEHVRLGRARMVISDWLMPQMSGLELCQAIRSEPSLGCVYFIMLTIMSDHPHLLEAFEAGVDDFMSKPPQQEELLARLRVGVRMLEVQDKLRQDAARMVELNQQLVTSNERLQQAAMTDELTGLPNRRYAMKRLAEEWAASERSGVPLTCAMVDVDRFKSINDEYGHDVGDAVMRQVGSTLCEVVRGSDVVCRIGGDEFLIVFPHQNAEKAIIGANRCRETIANSRIEEGRLGFPVTISVGVADLTLSGISTADDLLKACDVALYAAKRTGRNAVHVS